MILEQILIITQLWANEDEWKICTVARPLRLVSQSWNELMIPHVFRHVQFCYKKVKYWPRPGVPERPDRAIICTTPWKPAKTFCQNHAANKDKLLALRELAYNSSDDP